MCSLVLSIFRFEFSVGRCGWPESSMPIPLDENAGEILKMNFIIVSINRDYFSSVYLLFSHPTWLIDMDPPFLVKGAGPPHPT